MTGPQPEAVRGDDPAHGQADDPFGVARMTSHAASIVLNGRRPAVIDIELAIIKRTLTASYRQQAGWTDDSHAIRDLLDLAAHVERFEPGDACCPCCQEVTCDTGCPLEPVRERKP